VSDQASRRLSDALFGAAFWGDSKKPRFPSFANWKFPPFLKREKFNGFPIPDKTKFVIDFSLKKMYYCTYKSMVN